MIYEPFYLQDRTLKFSKAVILFCRELKPDLLNRSIIFQLIKSATSIGANYSEANNASSKQDFRNKIFIAKKEAAETKYWLSLLEDLVENKETCLSLGKECHFILMTLQKIVSTVDHGKRKNA